MQLEDMYRIKMMGDVQISKNGVISFVAAKMSRSKDTYQSQIYIYDGKLKKFTSGPKDSSPRFTEDGKRLVYVRRGKDKSELRIILIDGGESEKIAERKEGFSSLIVRGNYAYFLSEEEKKKDDDVKRINRIPFYFNGEGFIYDKTPQIYRVKLKGGKVEKLTEEKRIIQGFDVFDDMIIYSAADDEKEPFLSHLYLLKDGRTKKLTNKKADIMDFQISPDGKRIAVFLKFNEKGFAEDSRLYFLPINGGKYELACERAFSYGKSLNSDVRFGGGRVMRWTSDDEIMFIATEKGKQSLFLFSNGKCKERLGGERSIETFDYNGDKLVFIAQEINYPSEVFIKKNKERRITNFNRRFKNLKKPEHFRFKASDGVEIDGWIVLPEGKKPYPAILEIHGGPKTSYGHAFMFEFYYLLSKGYAVFYVNPRGSSGYGEDFALAVRGAFGKRDYKDIMEAVEYVKKNYPIDPKRIFVTGGSYGGFMTNWIVGHTNIFRAAVTQRSISNQLSFWGTSDIGPWFNTDYIGAGMDLWEGLDAYWDMSPLKYAKNIKTPLLIIHSEEDYRCPVSEAYQLFYALKMNSVDTKLVLFPEENHDLSRSGKPKHREARLKEMEQWFREHMK